MATFAGDPDRGPRFVVSFSSSSWQSRPQGYHTGTWTSVGPVWIRLGRRKHWEIETEETLAEMITPVKPPS